MSALLAMGLIGVVVGGTPDANAWVGGSGTIYMQQGQTTTLTNSGTVMPEKAAPAVKAPPYGH